MLELEVDPSITDKAQRAAAAEEMKEIVRMWDRVLMAPTDPKEPEEPEDTEEQERAERGDEEQEQLELW